MLAMWKSRFRPDNPPKMTLNVDNSGAAWSGRAGGLGVPENRSGSWEILRVRGRRRCVLAAGFDTKMGPALAGALALFMPETLPLNCYEINRQLFRYAVLTPFGVAGTGVFCCRCQK
jgi:hypothetical protein